MLNLRILGSWDTVTEDHRDRASHRVRGVLARREEDANQVAQVVVRLGHTLNEAGKRTPQCRIQVQRRDGQVLRARAQGKTLEQAIDRAAKQLRALWSQAKAPARQSRPAWQPSDATA